LLRGNNALLVTVNRLAKNFRLHQTNLFLAPTERISVKRLQDGKPVHHSFEIAFVLVRFDHGASIIVNAKNGIM
jgi:hypothetical protein